MTKSWKAYIAIGVSTTVLLIGGGVGVRKITDRQEAARVEDKVAERLNYLMNNVDTLRMYQSKSLWRTDMERLLVSMRFPNADRDTVIIERHYQPIITRTVTITERDTVLVRFESHPGDWAKDPRRKPRP